MNWDTFWGMKHCYCHDGRKDDGKQRQWKKNSYKFWLTSKTYVDIVDLKREGGIGVGVRSDCLLTLYKAEPELVCDTSVVNVTH